MKYLFFTCIIFLCFFNANAQLKVDAGNDVVLCFSDLSSSSTQLGGTPVASGGVEPYKYTWSGKILQHFGPKDSTWVYSSYFLNDTTLSNPTFKRGKIAFEWPVFKLKVEDAAGKVQYDSVKIIDGSIFILNSYMIPITIKRGDSVQFYGDRYFYENKFLPLKYTFIPTTGLSDPINLKTWAKPDKSTTYYLQVINSVGCKAATEYWRIIVEPPTLSNKETAKQVMQCYLANGDLVVNRAANNCMPYNLTIATANGVVIHKGQYMDRELQFSGFNLKENQLYIVTVIDGNEKQTFKLIGK